jgi:DNA repair ATPase RecN
VTTIHGEDRELELARMLGDAEGDAARKHARAMLGQGRTAGRRG